MKSATVVFGSLILGAILAPLQGQQYVISTFAGGGPPLSAPAPGLSVSLGYINSVAADSVGNVYIASATFSSVFKLDQSGVVTPIAGNGQAGYAGDGGPAASAQLNHPSGVAVDGTGNLFIADFGRIRRVSLSGIITTVAGNGTSGPGFSGDGGPATDAQIAPVALAVDNAGNIFFAEPASFRVRKVSASGIISTVAGNGAAGTSGDGGPATAAQMIGPHGLAFDPAGDLFIVDGARLREVSPAGIINTVAGVGAANTPIFTLQQCLAVDSAGNVFFEDSSDRVQKLSTDGSISTVGGNGSYGYAGDGGPATAAQIGWLPGIAVDRLGNLFIADDEGFFGGHVRKISGDGIITTVAGGACCSSGDGGPAIDAQLSSPWDVAVDAAGNVYIADMGNARARKVSPDGVISTVTAVSQPYSLYGLAVDQNGMVLVADSQNHVIRGVAPDGSSTIVAGNGTQGFSGDGGPATSAQLAYPMRVATDRAGDIFILDDAGSRIRKVSPDGIITTLAGATSNGFSGDGGPAVDAQIDAEDGGCDGPGGGMAVDAVGDLYFADTYNNRVRQIAPNGIINTIGGNGDYAFSGDGGPVNNALFNEPFSLAFDPAGNLFIADFWNARIRKVTPLAVITTVAGNGTWAYSGDGGSATAATLSTPAGIAADAAGNIYVADAYNNVVRVLRPTNFTIFIKTVVDAASQQAGPVSPGKIVTIYGNGLGPSQLTQNQAAGGVYGTSLSGTSVTFNGIAAPLLYTSSGQVGVVVPYAVTGTSAQVTVNYQGQVSNSFTAPVALAAPSLFTHNQTGAGEAVAINTRDGTTNSAANPVKIGDSITLFATGGGQTSPPGVDGALSGSTASQLLLSVSATIGGISASVQALGGAPGQIAGVMQVTLQVPSGVQPGGYVPVVLQVGDASSPPGAVWIAVSGN